MELRNNIAPKFWSYFQVYIHARFNFAKYSESVLSFNNFIGLNQMARV